MDGASRRRWWSTSGAGPAPSPWRWRPSGAPSEVHAVDVDPGAVAVTRANLAGLGVAGARASASTRGPGSPPCRRTWPAGSPWSWPPTRPTWPPPTSSRPRWGAGSRPRALVPGPTGLEAVERHRGRGARPGWCRAGRWCWRSVRPRARRRARRRDRAAGLVEAEVRTRPARAATATLVARARGMSRGGPSIRTPSRRVVDPAGVDPAGVDLVVVDRLVAGPAIGR